MKFFLTYLGGQMADSRIGEDHEAVLLVAEDGVEAKSIAKKKWKGKGVAHLDYLVEINVVDGYKILLERDSQQTNLDKESDWSKLNSK